MDRPICNIDEKGLMTVQVNLNQDGGLWVALGAGIYLADMAKAYFQDQAMKKAEAKARLSIIKPNGVG